jgi:hypothetical protein
MLWVWLAHAWCDWRSAVYIVKPETVVACHRRGFRWFWPGKADTAPAARACRTTFAR